mgnify:CR=1 FL=1
MALEHIPAAARNGALLVEPAAGERPAPHFVVQQEYLHPVPGLVGQYPAQAPPEVVIPDNIKLEENVIFRRPQALHDTVEGLLAIDQQIETVFLMAEARHQAIASKLVKEIARLNGDVSKFVTPRVNDALKQRLG